jgi:hypothetical protein
MMVGTQVIDTFSSSEFRQISTNDNPQLSTSNIELLGPNGGRVGGLPAVQSIALEVVVLAQSTTAAIFRQPIACTLSQPCNQ